MSRKDVKQIYNTPFMLRMTSNLSVITLARNKLEKNGFASPQIK